MCDWVLPVLPSVHWQQHQQGWGLQGPGRGRSGGSSLSFDPQDLNHCHAGTRWHRHMETGLHVHGRLQLPSAETQGVIPTERRATMVPAHAGVARAGGQKAHPVRGSPSSLTAGEHHSRFLAQVNICTWPPVSGSLPSSMRSPRTRPCMEMRMMYRPVLSPPPGGCMSGCSAEAALCSSCPSWMGVMSGAEGLNTVAAAHQGRCQAGGDGGVAASAAAASLWRRSRVANMWEPCSGVCLGVGGPARCSWSLGAALEPRGGRGEPEDFPAAMLAMLPTQSCDCSACVVP